MVSCSVRAGSGQSWIGSAVPETSLLSLIKSSFARSSICLINWLANVSLGSEIALLVQSDVTIMMPLFSTLAHLPPCFRSGADVYLDGVMKS